MIVLRLELDVDKESWSRRSVIIAGSSWLIKVVPASKHGALPHRYSGAQKPKLA